MNTKRERKKEMEMNDIELLEIISCLRLKETLLKELSRDMYPKLERISLLREKLQDEIILRARKE